MNNRKQNWGSFFLVSIIFIIWTTKLNAKLGEDYKISAQMQKQIMHSELTARLHRSDGKELIVYLYAEDEKREYHEMYSCVGDGEEKSSVMKTGHYYIYLYDVSQNIFLQKRIKIFKDYGETSFNVEGADMFVLNGSQEKKSDVLLISQFGTCSGDDYEAYGFSKNELSLINYFFVFKKRYQHYFGRISKDKKSSKLSAYNYADDHQGIIVSKTLSISNKFRELQFELASTPK